jgi:hypothetical protein
MKYEIDTLTNNDQLELSFQYRMLMVQGYDYLSC